MTNHAPTFTSSAATASFSEFSDTTGSTTDHLASGTLNFKDSDKTDTHTTSASLRTAVWSGGSVIPTVSLADLTSAMSSTIQSDSNGSGSVAWNFAADDRDFDFLAKNETLTLTYDVFVNDNHGGTAKQTVKITVTGTDDKPVFNVVTAASVDEQDNQTLSFAPDTAHVTLNFVDPDLNNTNYSASVLSVSADGNTDGLLPGFLGTAELMSFFHVDNIVKAAGSSSGAINTTFSAPDLAFDYLAAGETLNITYKVQLDDHAGGVSTQDVVVTVVGSNDAPVFISAAQSAHFVEDQAPTLTAHGDLFFTDVDLHDAHTVSTTVTATRSGGGGVPLSDAALLADFTTGLEDSTGHIVGEVDWDFAAAANSFAFLSGGETLTLVYHVSVTDPSGASTTRDVTITVLGVNHPVAMVSDPESDSVTEQDSVTASGLTDATATQTLSFTDQDLSDTHTVAVTAGSPVWSGGSSIPAQTETDLATALSTTLHDSTGTGSGGVDWTFSLLDNDLDFLAAGETLTVTYNVAVSDASTSASQTVTITMNGANDLPLITSGPESAAVSELPNTGGSTALDTTATQTLNFTDPDLNDTHSVSVALNSVVWSADGSIPFQTFSDLFTALATTLHDSTGTGAGGIDWSFAIQDRDLDFLSDGETLTVTYDVTVADAAASSTQQVTIVIAGAEDPVVVNSLTATANDTQFPDNGNPILFGNLINDAGDSTDASNPLSVTDVNGTPISGALAVTSTYGTLLVDEAGNYQFIANSALDALQVGNDQTETFNFTVSDSHGNPFAATLTLNIVATDDAPTMTGGNVFGAVTEDAGPDAAVNGGFETGSFLGWNPSGSVSVPLTALGGQFGNYSAELDNGSVSQDIATVAGQHYTLSFWVAGNPEASSSAFSVSWNDSVVLALADPFPGFTHYTIDVVGNGSAASTTLSFSGATDGGGMFLDQVSVTNANGQSTESTDGNVTFSDVETGDTHTAVFTPLDTGYVGTFSLDPVSESGGSGSVAWHFTVNNSDIQFLAQDQQLVQTYTVSITDNHGISSTEDVSVTLVGTNDAPTAVNDNVITDADVSPGAVGLPGWALAHNDTDPDTIDTLGVDAASVGGASGGGTIVLGDVVGFFEDGTLGGSFTYQTFDGHTTSANSATVNITNNPAGSTLTGTGGADIIVGVYGGETMSGGGGNDILITNGSGYSLAGGGGDDIFAFESNTGPSSITDFNNTTQHDQIAISASSFGSLTAGMDVSPFFESTGDDQFSSDFFILFHYDTANETLYFSPDGTTASATAVAQFQPGVTLNPHDLLIVT